MPKSILIIKPSALGDIALALGALSSLRASFPQAKISWFVRREFAPLIADDPNLDEVIIFERKFLGKWWYHTKAFWALVNLIRRLHRGRFDIVFDFQGLFRTALFGWFSGSKKRFGMSTARECATLLYTDKIRCDADKFHLMDCYQKMLSAAGACVQTTELELGVSAEDEKSVQKLLSSSQVSGQGYAVLVPGAARQYKCWPVEKFALISEKIVSEYGLDIIAVGTAGEKSIIEKLQSLSGVRVIDFSGRTNISELVALLKNAKLVVSNDTGPGHIAAAMRVPLVMIFGATNPARVGPYKRPDAVAAVDPFERGQAIESPDTAHQIGAVTLEMVFEKVMCQLAKGAENKDVQN
jgi:heptosyltransferase-1